MRREGFMTEVFSFAENIQWHIFKWQEVYMETGNVCLPAAWWKCWQRCGGFLVSANLGKTQAMFAVVCFHSMYNASTTCMALLSYTCICIASVLQMGWSYLHQLWCHSYYWGATNPLPSVLVRPCSSTYSSVCGFQIPCSNALEQSLMPTFCHVVFC